MTMQELVKINRFLGAPTLVGELIDPFTTKEEAEEEDVEEISDEPEEDDMSGASGIGTESANDPLNDR